MRLTGLFSGSETLASHGAALSVIADNLANMNTVGFKGRRSEFSDLVAESIGNLYGSGLNPGNGAQVEDIRVLHNRQGSIEFTDRSLDLAIQGNGYFLVNDGTNTFLTRNGIFSVDQQGNVVDASGHSLMGFTEASQNNAVPLQLPNGQISATPTTAVGISGNLNTSDPIVPPPPNATFQDLNTGVSFRSFISVIDSLGESHDVTLYFYHTDNLTYEVQAYVDGADTGGVPGTPVQIGTAQIAFDATGLQAEGVAPMNLAAAWGNGANASAVALDLSGVTGFASASAFTSATRDGNRAGTIIGYSVERDGTINGVLDNGEFTAIGTVALGNVRNPDGLVKVGNNKFVLGEGSGELTVGTPGTEGYGEVLGGALENSTVDPANEFVDMIRYQRGYQAGSQVVRTLSELLGATIQIA